MSDTRGKAARPSGRRWKPDSVRSRAAIAATLVVAVALVGAGFLVLDALGSSLTRQADLQAEVVAREIASQVALGNAPSTLQLPDTDEHPIWIADRSGRTVAAAEDLTAIDGRPVPSRPSAGSSPSPSPSPTGRPSPPAGGGDEDEKENHFDDHSPPGRGRISTDVDYRGGDATIEGKTRDYRFAGVEATAPNGQTVRAWAGAPLTSQPLTTTARSMLLGLPVLLAVVAVVTWLVTRRALRPVEGIRSEMAEITASADLARRVPVPTSRDEVADLAVTTNQTLAALEQAVERQRRFVADASHELRSPIASLRTQLEVSGAHPELLDLHGLTQDVIRLQDLAADLLLLARLDAGQRPAQGLIAPAELVVERLSQRPVTDRVPIRPVLEPGTEGLSVRGTRSHLDRVIANLLDNAQRHARSRVTIVVGRTDDEVVIRVADDGPGVPLADRDRVFERFVRLDEARDRDDGGAGLGLAISREVVRAHGGTLTISENPGGGALFEVRLPLA